MTLKSIAGIVDPDKGIVSLTTGEKTVYFDSDKKINLKPQKRNVGYLFQNYALFPNMTVEENVGIGLSNHDENVVSEMIRRFHLEGLEKRYPRQLSGGQQQRVALARIMAYGPDVILLDEPFSALDAITKQQMHQWFLDMAAHLNLSALLITHDIDEAILLADRIYVLGGSPGKIVGEFGIGIPRPRNKETVLTDGFRFYKKQIMELLG
jgi:molybdate transport system ATP-binding protein